MQTSSIGILASLNLGEESKNAVCDPLSQCSMLHFSEFGERPLHDATGQEREHVPRNGSSSSYGRKGLIKVHALNDPGCCGITA
eukprot:2342134-Amphidinium_carterae.2